MPFRLPLRRKGQPPTPPQPPPERSAQMQSPFFAKLPLELRLRIYELALYVGSAAVVEELRPEQQRRPSKIIRVGGDEVQPLSLLQSCERMHAEARPVLYTCNTLRIYSFTILRVPRRAWAAWVRSVHFSWRLNDPVGAVRKQQRHGCVHGIRDVSNEMWADAWNVLAALPNLAWLRVELELHPNAMLAFMARENHLLAPLQSILRPSATGHLCLNWPREVPLAQSAEGLLPLWKVERDLDWYNAYVKNRRGW